MLRQLLSILQPIIRKKLSNSRTDSYGAPAARMKGSPTTPASIFNVIESRLTVCALAAQ
jgi:hypothetical protein